LVNHRRGVGRQNVAYPVGRCPIVQHDTKAAVANKAMTGV
jgi:hypothetical protein